MVVSAKDLSPAQRLAVEGLLGRPVSDQETVTVQAFEPPSLSDGRREEIAQALGQYFAEVDAHRQAVSDEEAEEIIDEAMRTSRPGFRPRP